MENKEERYHAMYREGRISSLALDGLDGSGKGSCTDLLAKEIAKLGKNVVVIDYPQYDTGWGKFIKHLLRSSDENLSIHQMMTTYAANRLESVKPMWDHVTQMATGNDRPIQILFDRYVTSNILTLAYYHANQQQKGQDVGAIDPARLIDTFYAFFWQLDGLFVESLQLETAQIVIPQVQADIALRSLSLDETRTEGSDKYEVPDVQDLAHRLYAQAARIDSNMHIINQDRTLDIRESQRKLVAEIMESVLLIQQRDISQAGQVRHLSIAQPVGLEEKDIKHLKGQVRGFQDLLNKFDRFTKS
ncbi:MAG: hypothetical protein ACMG6E_01175 [Candidatus Roizmanbacteria bacterium]